MGGGPSDWKFEFKRVSKCGKSERMLPGPAMPVIPAVLNSMPVPMAPTTPMMTRSKKESSFFREAVFCI